MLVVVPDSLRDAINRKLDAALRELPDAEAERDHLYHQLLDYFYDHGALPEFTVMKVNGAALADAKETNHD